MDSGIFISENFQQSRPPHSHLTGDASKTRFKAEIFTKLQLASPPPGQAV
jgi:hypothetical protein